MRRAVISPRRRSSGLRIALLGVAGFLLAPVTANAGTLDQGNEADVFSQSIGCGINGCVSGAQTFTAGRSGGLDRVDLHLDRNGDVTNPPLTVEIRNVESGSPGTTVLDSATVPASSVPTSGDWVAVDFLPSLAPIEDGAQYAIVAYAGGEDYFYAWSLGSSYDAGQAFQSSVPPTTWTESGEFAFKTYVTPVHSLILIKNGSGSITSDPAGIDCGATCSTTFAEGTQVTLTANPAPGFTFTGWSGAYSGTGPCQVTMGGDQAVSASFTANATGPPNTTIDKAKIRDDRRRASFRFGAEGQATHFECKLTGEGKGLRRWRGCTSPKRYTDLGRGRHTFSVRAVGPGGTDDAPARKRFRIA